jgi:uncharacterized membrane protein
VNVQPQEIAKRIFLRERERLSNVEKRVLQHLVRHAPISRDTHKEFEDDRTPGERAADRIASFGGSWTFLGLFALVLVAWVVVNTVLLGRSGREFDPYPYILLNLVLSMLAAVQAPVIMMSQNRQAAKDRLDAAHDYEVNLKAEIEIQSLHEKLDLLRQEKWMELVTLQQRQIEMLQQLVEHAEGARHPGRSTPEVG